MKQNYRHANTLLGMSSGIKSMSGLWVNQRSSNNKKGNFEIKTTQLMDKFNISKVGDSFNATR